MKKTLFIFELHGSTDVVEFFRRNIPMLHERGYRNIGYELNQSEAERVINPMNKLVGVGGRPSPRQAINDLFMSKNAHGKITGLDVPELNQVNRFILNMYLTSLFEKIHFVRDHQIFHQARKSTEHAEYGSVNLVGCNHIGIMHQLIAHALSVDQLDLLKQCKFVFLVETGYPIPPHLFGTELPGYPLDALFINTSEGLAGTEKKLIEYLDRPVRIPDEALLLKIKTQVEAVTKQQTEFYNSYCTKLFQVFNAGEKYGIQADAIMYAQGAFSGIISELAQHTLEAVNNNGYISCPVPKISKSAIAILKAVGFQFTSPKQRALEAYRSNKFELAERLFEQCLNESNDELESISMKYNLGSACRQTGKVEKSLKLFYEVAVKFFEYHQKDLSKERSTLCKYLSRYFDLLKDHDSYRELFESETQELFDTYQRAQLEDETLSIAMQAVIPSPNHTL